MKQWVVKNPDKGYMHEDEDKLDGFGYDWNIDDFTIFFESEENAKLNCSRGDVVELI